MSATAIVTGVAGLLKQVLPRVLTDKDKAAEIEERLELELHRAAQDERSEFYSFILDFEGRAAEMPRSVQIIRALIRPLITVLVVFGYLWGFLHPQDGFTPDQMAMLHTWGLLILGFWFGERALKNLGANFKFLAPKGQQD